MRTSDAAANPVYVSVGHKISLNTAVELVVACSVKRVPEPVRQVSDVVVRSMTVYIHIILLCTWYMYICYMIKRDNIQSNTIQHNNTRDKLFFSKEKWAASGGIRTHDTLFSRPSATEAAQMAGLKSTNTTQYKAKQSVSTTCINTGYLYSVWRCRPG